MKAILAAMVIIVAAFPAYGTAPQVRGQATLLVQVHPGTTAATRERLQRSLNGTITGQIPQLNVLSLSVPADRVSSAVQKLVQDPAIVYAEPDAQALAARLHSPAAGFRNGPAAIPDDPGWPRQWGPQKIQAPGAWNITLGSTKVIVAVVDSGVTLDHPDLANQLWTNPGEVPANGIDDDGNGQVDDVWGWHYFHLWDGQAFVPMENNQVEDDYGHGTLVTGITGAETSNGLGIAGMAGMSRLMIIKVLDEYGVGWYFDIAKGIVYAVDNGADVINLSLGGKSASETLQSAVDYAHAQGVLVVAATGNDGGTIIYPAACDHALAVAATDMDDRRPLFSNFGPQVDVAGPGVEILSTWPWRDGYWTESGTSTAAPHVSGLAALILSMHSSWDPNQVSRAITATAVDVDPPGWDPYTGWGRIDAKAAVSYDTVLVPVYLPIITQHYYPK